MTYHLKIECLSDTCFSMPTSESVAVDQDIAYDKLGLPMISGKTIHGLLRDTWLMVQLYLDSAKEGYALVGDRLSHNQMGVLRIGDALLESEIRQIVYEAQNHIAQSFSQKMVIEAFTIKRIMTAQNRETGVPMTDTLRCIRVIPAGSVFYAPLDGWHNLSKHQVELFERLASLTRHAGLHRNRGLGHIQMSVIETHSEDTPPTKKLQNNEDHDTLFLHYRMRLTAPCIIAGKEVDTNSRLTRDYLPGTAIRGAIAKVLCKLQAQNILSEETLIEILASGNVRFLNAYLETVDKRTLPKPITWRRNKDASKNDKDANPHDALVSLFQPERSDEDLEKKQLEQLHYVFYAKFEGTLYHAKAKTRFTTHQTRNRKTGSTSKADSSTVFVYEALESEQSFRGCIAFPKDRTDLLDILTMALQSHSIWLGRSIRSGYGGVPDIETLHLAAHETDTDFTCNEIKEEDYFSVRLTSDAVLRDPETGQFDPWSLKKDVQNRFRDRAKVVAACVRGGQSREYNSLWRTEFPTVPCAEAGSVVLLQALKDINIKEILELQSQPIGERVAQGNGCFIITTDTIKNEALAIFKQEETKVTESPHVRTPEILKQAQKRLYRAKIRLFLSDLAISTANRATRLPSSSLIQRMRIPLRDEDWKQTYAKWLEERSSDALRPAATNALKRCSLPGDKERDKYQSLHEFLKSSAGNDWLPPLVSENKNRGDYRLIPNAEAQKAWDEVRKESVTFYLDLLLSLMAKSSRDAAREDR